MSDLSIGSIYFADLAQQYFPTSSKENARRNLNNHIRKCVPLHKALRETGYANWNHRILTPRQHRLIVSHLGDTDQE